MYYGSSAPLGQIQRRACTRISNDPARMRYSIPSFSVSSPLRSSFSTVTSARPLENPWKVLVFRERTNNCENLVNLAPKRAKGEGFASKTRDFFIDESELQTGGECGLGWRTMEQTYPRLPTILELGIRRATYTESVLIARGSTARF